MHVSGVETSCANAHYRASFLFLKIIVPQSIIDDNLARFLQNFDYLARFLAACTGWVLSLSAVTEALSLTERKFSKKSI